MRGFLGLSVCFLLCLIFFDGVVCEGRDFYKILGVSRDASPKQIKKAFRTLSMKYHPDKDKENKDLYMDINAAYEMLSDPDKRRQYDQLGEEGMKEAARRGGGSGGFDPFADFFGFGRRQQQQTGGLRDGESFEVEVFVSLEDLYNGREMRFLHRKQVLCHKCRGSGAKKAEDVVKCSECGGTGTKTTTKRLGPGFVQQMQSTCNKCGGKGVIAKSKCPHCQGKKVEMGAVDHYLIIERGMPDGHKVSFKSGWDEEPETNPGDLIFQIRTQPHPVFSRSGNDLHMTLTISLLESLVGFTKEVTHLDGHIVAISSKDVTIPGQVLTKKGEGMPYHEYSSQKGDLHTTIFVQFPESLSSHQKEGIRKILS